MLAVPPYLESPADWQHAAQNAIKAALTSFHNGYHPEPDYLKALPPNTESERSSSQLKAVIRIAARTGSHQPPAL